jgi:hypothetical protein
MTPPATDVGVGFGKSLVPSPTSPLEVEPQQYAEPLPVSPQLCSPPDVTDLSVMNGSTTMLAAPILPSIVAVIVTPPGDTVVIKPLSETVADDGYVDAHRTTRPTSALPLESLAVAPSIVVARDAHARRAW